MTSSSRARPRLVWLAVAPSPYNDYLFRCLAGRYDLIVVYQRKSIATHPWQLEPARYPVLDVRASPLAVVAAVRRADVTVMSGWNDPAYLALMPILRRPRAFWTDTPDTSVRRGARARVRSEVIRYVFRHFDQVWGTGRPGREVIVSMGCAAQKARELPFFLDLDRLASARAARGMEAAAFRRAHGGDGRVVFMGAGQLAAKKRYEDAITALARLDDARSVLWLCGVGPEETALRDAASRLGVADRVVFHGWLQPAAMELAFLACDVFVHPAARDPFPTVVLDAMTWGRPVIGTSVSGSVIDRVTSGIQGVVIEPGDVVALTEAMRSLLDDARRASMGAQARAKAEQYPIARAFERVDELAGSSP